jgi:hypothetical protein
VARSTLADANEPHDWRIFADFAQVLIRIARPPYAYDEIGVDLDQSLYALDSTTIDLCLSLFPRAKFRQRKAAVKMILCWICTATCLACLSRLGFCGRRNSCLGDRVISAVRLVSRIR